MGMMEERGVSVNNALPEPCRTHISDSKRFVWLQAEVVGPAVTLGIVADQALPGNAVQHCRQIQFDVFAGEVVDDNELLASQAAPVGEYLRVLLQQRQVLSVNHDVPVLAQFDQLLVVEEDRIGLFQRGRDVDLGVVWIQL